MSVQETGRTLNITPATGQNGNLRSGYLSASTYDLTNAAASVQVRQVTNDSGGAETYFYVGLDANNYYRIAKSSDGVLYFQAKVAGVVSGSTVFYNTTYRWWRIRHVPATDQIVFETSPDNQTWTINFNIARPFSNAGLKINLAAGTFNATPTPGAAIFDDFLFSIGGAPFPAPVPVTLLADDFNDNVGPPVETTKWVLGYMNGPNDPNTVVQETGGQLHITPRINVDGVNINGYMTANSFDFHNSWASVEVVQATSSTAGAETYLYVGLDANNWYRIVRGDPPPDGKLYFQWVVNGGAVQESTTKPPYDPVQHRFWRIRHDRVSDWIFFETSPDGVTWTTQHGMPRLFTNVGLKINIAAGTHKLIPDPGTATFDNFQIISLRSQ